MTAPFDQSDSYEDEMTHTYNKFENATNAAKASRSRVLVDVNFAVRKDAFNAKGTWLRKLWKLRIPKDAGSTSCIKPFNLVSL
mmetsp:Transcript_11245/g.15846  ORF Transcript_11245/g.15846 Transcript_11245/m.15846 type:complete len:83 (-) Transcript_11245:1430-1678(-)